MFAKYGLTDKAIERLRVLVRRRPDLYPARERLVDLLKETQNPAFPKEAQDLAEAYRAAGRAAQADTLLGRLRLSSAGTAPGSGPVSPPPPASDVQFDEFNLEPAHPPPAEFVEEFGSETVRFSSSDLDAAGAPPPAPAARDPRRTSTPLEPMATVDSDFVSYEELGSLLDDEMQKAGDTIRNRRPRCRPRRSKITTCSPMSSSSSISPRSSKRSSPRRVRPRPLRRWRDPKARRRSRRSSGSSRRASSSSFRPRTTKRTSISGSPTRRWVWSTRPSASSSSRARIPRGPSSAAACSVSAFSRRACRSSRSSGIARDSRRGTIRELETVGLLYDLGCVYQSTGDVDLAYRTFLEVYGLNTNYRDIVHRVRELEEVRKS